MPSRGTELLHIASAARRDDALFPADVTVQDGRRVAEGFL